MSPCLCVELKASFNLLKNPHKISLKRPCGFIRIYGQRTNMMGLYSGAGDGGVGSGGLYCTGKSLQHAFC